MEIEDSARIRKNEKLFNLLMNFRLGRTPTRKILFLDFRSVSEFKARHIADFSNIPDVPAAETLIDRLALESKKFNVFAVFDSESVISDLFQSRVDQISTLVQVNLEVFTSSFPFLVISDLSAESERRFAASAFPTFAAEDLLFAGLFAFNTLTISVLKISVLIDLTPNGLSEISVPVRKCTDISSAALAVSDLLAEGKRVLVVDAKDGIFAALAATAGIGVYRRLDATSAVSRVMAKTNLGFNPSAEEVNKISTAISSLKVSPRTTASLAEENKLFSMALLQSIPGIYTRIRLPGPRTGEKFPEDSLDALQEQIVTKREHLSLSERDTAVEKLAWIIDSCDFNEERDRVRQATALLAYIADEWPEEVELSPTVEAKIREISAFCFENEPSEYYSEIEYSNDGFPASLTDCMRALVIALHL